MVQYAALLHPMPREPQHYQQHKSCKCRVEVEANVRQVDSRLGTASMRDVGEPVRRKILMVDCCQFSVNHPQHHAYEDDRQSPFHWAANLTSVSAPAPPPAPCS